MARRYAVQDAAMRTGAADVVAVRDQVRSIGGLRRFGSRSSAKEGIRDSGSLAK
jgi:hypothetical protein